MTVESGRRSRSKAWIALVVGSVALTALPGTSLVASAQDQSAATAADAILARKALMSTINDHMDQIEGMISAGKINLPAAHRHADNVSAMLMAFPHLFPPSSNQWKAGADRDPVTDTLASPETWTKFPDFYQRASAASKVAYVMSAANSADELKARAAELRTACNQCHAAYLKTSD